VELPHFLNIRVASSSFESWPLKLRGKEDLCPSVRGLAELQKGNENYSVLFMSEKEHCYKKEVNIGERKEGDTSTNAMKERNGG
jgi:hypothetical protein